MRIPVLPALALTLIASAASAEDEGIAVPGPHGGAAYYANAEQKKQQDGFGYAAAYRAGDFVYISGVVAGSPDGEPLDREAFKERLRATFREADANFKAAGASLEEVIDITSFHVWDSRLYPGGKFDHLSAVAEVKREFMPLPDPTWTAIGISELVPDNDIIEIRMIAYSPKKKSKR
ncbi:MAG: Rid family hydrolase [Parvularculaceae bacterium]